MIREISHRVYAYRNGVRFRELACVSAPFIQADMEADLKTACRVSVRHDPEVDLLSDEIRPFLLINGEERPLGVFRVASVSSSYGTERVDDLEAYDLAYVLQAKKTTDIYRILMGTNYASAISLLLNSAGILKAHVTPKSAAMGSGREWDIGTSYLEIVNELLTEINYQPLWFDVTGAAVAAPAPELTADRISHVYDSRHAFVQARFTASQDVWEVPNVLTVVCESPDLAQPLTATVKNTNAQSALSTVRRGMEVVMVEQLDNIASQAELDRYAARRLTELSYAAETVSIQTELEDGHGLGDVVGLALRDRQGIYQEVGWQMTLSAGQTMQHTLRRVIYD